MKKKIGLLVAALMLVSTYSVNVFAAPNSTFNQAINTGALSTDILDASQAPVASPSITMTSKAFSFSCYDGSNPSTGVFGVNAQRIYVINPDASDTGWNLSVAATDGATAEWENTGVTESYDFNDPTGSACTDGADTDSTGGQMTIDANAGTVTLDCGGTCTSTGITKGSSAAFEEGVADDVTLLSASAGSDDNWRGYLTGAAVEQTIPAQQASDSYAINMTLTIVAA